jgi:hypothetical protein
MKNPGIPICNVIETKMKLIINKINQIDDAIEADPLLSELRIIDWILYLVCGNERKRFEMV